MPLTCTLCVSFRYPIGLVIRGSATRRTSARPRRRPTLYAAKNAASAVSSVNPSSQSQASAGSQEGQSPGTPTSGSGGGGGGGGGGYGMSSGGGMMGSGGEYMGMQNGDSYQLPNQVGANVQSQVLRCVR